MFSCFPVEELFSRSVKLEDDDDSLENEKLRGFDDEDDVLELEHSEVVSGFEAPKLNQGGALSGEKLRALRRLMKDYGVGVYLVPSEDEHQSEYTALADKRREYLSGFSGSAGICVVTLDDAANLAGEAALSTDGRYFLQAEKELDANHWTLLKQGAAGYPTWQEYAVRKAEQSGFSNVISCDPELISLSTGERFLRMAGNFKFKPILEVNFVDEIWEGKPQRSLDPVYEFPLEYSGESASAKIARVRSEMEKLNGTHLVVSALDEVAWLLNLRADTDIPFSPVFFSYVIVDLKKVTLYINRQKLANVKNYLNSIDVLVKDSADFLTDLQLLSSDSALILPDKASTTYAVSEAVKHIPTQYNSVVSFLKLVKNKTERFNATVAQHKDSLVFIILGSWLETQLQKNRNITEFDAASKIYALREQMPNFKGLSYETIASTGTNAAIIHYAPTKENCKKIDPSKVFLLDSGAHYLEGTTDITRTYKFGYNGVTDRLRKLYTLVLKSHLAVATAVFPSGGSCGGILDAYSRQPLWNEGLDFNHGTGHGVGSFGNVHEGPLYISTTAGGSSTQDVFKVGGILSDEPGVYLEKEELGIRIESELEIIEHSSTDRNGKPMLAFKYLTQVPFCRKLIDKYYLSGPEIDWINRYHSNIRATFSGKLIELGEYRAERWLMNETRPL